MKSEKVYGDEELFVEELEAEAERAKRSHTDGSHVNPELTYQQRITYGSMLRELAGDI